MKKTSYFVLPFFILICFSISPSLANTQIKVSSFGRLNYPAPTPSGQIKILRQSFQEGAWSASKFASIIDVYQGHYNALSKVPEMKAIRPDIIAFVYYNTIALRRPGHIEYEPDKYALFMANGWVLKDIYGEYVSFNDGLSYYVDFGNPDFHTWLANWHKHYIDKYGLDGASLDNVFWDSMVWYVTSQTAVNPRTGNPWTNQEICDAYKAMTIKVRDTIGSGKHVLVNGIFNGNHFHSPSRNQYFIDGLLNGGIDSVISEGWINYYDASEWYSEDKWLNSITFALWLEANFPAKGGKYFMPIHADASFFKGNDFPSDMTEEEYQEFVLYGYASRLLTVNQLTSIISFGHYIEHTYAQSLFKIDIGTPSGDYYKIGSLYARQFTKGLVIVNPTYSSSQANLSGAFKNAVNGNSVSSILTVQSHTGIILSEV